MKNPLDLRPIIAALASTVEVSAIARYPHRFDVVPGSPADAEFAKQGRFAGPWSPTPLAEATMIGNTIVYAAEDHLRSMGELIAGGDSRLGPFVLARAAFEASARGWWIFDPDIGLEDRLCRGANATLNSFYERAKLDREMGVAETRAPKIKAIFDTAQQTGLPVTPSRKKSPRWLGDGWPDTTTLCRQFMEDSDQRSVGGVLYRYLCAMTHGTLDGLLRNVQPIEGLPPGQTGTMTTQEIDPHELAMFASSVLVAYVIAAERQMVYFGWNGPAWNEWKSAVRAAAKPYVPLP